MKYIAMRTACCAGLLAACATAPLRVHDAAHAIALAKAACRDFPHADTLTDWKAQEHGVEWEVEATPSPAVITGQGASVIVPVNGPAPTRCAEFYFKRG